MTKIIKHTITLQLDVDLDAYGDNYGHGYPADEATGYAREVARDAVARRLDEVGGWAQFANPLPAACMAGTCACPSTPDGSDSEHVTGAPEPDYRALLAELVEASRDADIDDSADELGDRAGRLGTAWHNAHKALQR